MSSAERILVVDDEEGIRRSLEGALRDEGYVVSSVESGVAAIKFLESGSADLILLDIWMPGLDGIETLKKIREFDPSQKVIMMSGHAGISTAMSAIKLGACDFLEKPLDLKLLLGAIKRAFSPDNVTTLEDDSPVRDRESVRELLSDLFPKISVEERIFNTKGLRGSAVQQRTLAKSAIVYGLGLHSGKKSGLMLEPLPPNSGIHFVAVNDQSPVAAHVDNVSSTGFATTLKGANSSFSTIEHLMSALHAYKISNLLVKCNGEVPVLDGSAREFCSLIESTGVTMQDGDWYSIRPDKVIRVGNDREYIQFEPGDGLVIDYTLDYPEPLGRINACFELSSAEVFRDEIAPCRTFGFVKDIGYLQQQGYALGGRFDNFILFSPEGPINDKLRFIDEPVRHKILDAMGDLFLLGRPLEGKITAHMTGHSDNVLLAREIWREILK